MAIANWPSTLRYSPGVSEFARKRREAAPNIGFEPEDGPMIMQVRSYTSIIAFDYAMIWTDAEYTIWENFVEVTLARGTLHFMMNVPMTLRTTSLRRCYIPNGVWEDEYVGRKLWKVKFSIHAIPAAP